MVILHTETPGACMFVYSLRRKQEHWHCITKVFYWNCTTLLFVSSQPTKRRHNRMLSCPRQKGKDDGVQLSERKETNAISCPVHQKYFSISSHQYIYVFGRARRSPQTIEETEMNGNSLGIVSQCGVFRKSWSNRTMIYIYIFCCRYY